MKNKEFIINAPDVVGEVIDNEAVILNLKRGLYYSCVTTASNIWQKIEAGYNLQMIYQDLSHLYQGTEQEIKDSLIAFIDDLQKNDLIREVSIRTQESLKLTGNIIKMDFEIPLLTVHADMKDLLLLDPIHDVDETSGWPMPKAD
ncbi:MAG: hypothetical protein ACI9QD_000728 [Thermoproteota archaeon]|jgi:hypothetical protein